MHWIGQSFSVVYQSLMFNNKRAGDIEILKVNEIAVHEESSVLEAPSGSSEYSLLREDRNGEMADDACDVRTVSYVPSDPIASSPIREGHDDDTPDVGDDKLSMSLSQVIYLLTFVFISRCLSYYKSIT